MEGLLEKIKKFTANGSPSVSELIELQEIARKIKVSRTDLEKMIKTSLSEAETSSPKEKSENSNQKRESSYQRPDYDATRNSFDAEMNQRRASESIPESPEITFNRPEIVFPEMDDPFAKKETTTNDESTPFLRRQEISGWFEKPPTLQKQSDNELPKHVENLKKEEKENYDRTSQQMMQEQRELQARLKKEREEALKKYEIEVEKRRNNKPIEVEELLKEEPPVSIDDILGAVSDSKNETKETIDNTSKTASFEVEFEKLEKLDQKDDLDDWIKNSNKETLARVKALTDKQNQIKQQKREAEFKRKQQEEKQQPKKSAEEWLKTPSKRQKPKKTSKNKKKRSFSRDNDSKLDDEAVKLTKSAFALGVTALVLSILFGTIGAIVGIFALNSASKGIKKYKINARSFEKGAISKLKNGRTMAIIGIVIGVFKFGRMFYWGYYFF